MVREGIVADNFCFVHSSELNINVQVKIGTLEGVRQRPGYEKLLDDPLLRFSGLYEDGCSDLRVECQLYSDGQPLALPSSTSYKSFTTRWNWNEWITLPLKYSDLPRNTQLCLTIYDCYGPNRSLPVGGTSVQVFSKYGVFRQGIHDLRVWPDKVADGSTVSSTPGKGRDDGKDQMQRLAKLAKKHRNGYMMKVDWLDRLTFREIELVNEKEKRSSSFMYVMVEFPRVEFDQCQYSVVYYERGGEVIQKVNTHTSIVTVPDQEIGQENLVESKHHKLARSLRSGFSDRDLKPNASIRDTLATIVNYPPTKQLSSEEQDLVWKFRYYLSSQKKALTKFLKCVNWMLPVEARLAQELLYLWVPMDVEDALELLGPTFTHHAVRRYAVSRLAVAPDEDLLLYLLQLVQALKYENYEEIKSQWESSQSKSLVHSLQSDSEILPEKCTATPPPSQQPELSSGRLVMEQKTIPVVTSRPPPTLMHQLSDSGKLMLGVQDVTNTPSGTDLTNFLINRACNNSKLANYFYWYLLIECEDQESSVNHDSRARDMYLIVMRMFSQALLKGGKECRIRRSILARQQTFVDRLASLFKVIMRESGNRKKKIERLQALLSDPDSHKINFSSTDPLPFPLDPDIQIQGIAPERASLFKSALMPWKLTFKTSSVEEYVTIFKHGDDLRQDQLILQIIMLLDKLLRKENLDLRLTPYRVLATSSKHGFIQYLDATSIADILIEDGSIQNYLRKHNPSETGPFGISSEVMDNYVRSCAGYCVITYLLGVGDRHLNNLLMTKSGRLFHIDFGYILGRDPKPLPPPMKMSKEMVEGMGGVGLEHYQEFRKQCYTAFLHLRRHANLILNLFSLMVDANVPDIALEPDKAVKKVQDKFRLDLGDEEGVQYMQNLIDDSVTAVMPALVEQLHKFTQYLRK